MPIFLLAMKQLRVVLGQAQGQVDASSPVSKTIRAAAAVGLAAMAFVRPPPSGFKVSDLAVGMTSPGRFDAITSTVRPVIAQMFFVMFSAAMLGLAQLVYTVFTRKWEQRGLPVLPINVLRPGAGGTATAGPGWAPGGTSFPGQAQAQARQGIPMGPASAPGSAPGQPTTRTGTIDEYKD